MGWKTTDVMQERIKYVIRASSGEEPRSSLCAEFGVHRSTGYRWLKRYEETGDINKLREHSRAPHRSPNKIRKDFEDRVVALRKRYGWGGKKLQVLLQEEGKEIPLATINRIIKRNGLIERPRVVTPALNRFERSTPNELWQMDFKGPLPAGSKLYHPLSVLDDHSRYAVGLYTLKDLKTESVHKSLVDAFETHGVPEGMLMDHGTPWWSNHNNYGLTRLSVALIKQDIKLHYGRIRHPQTQGKVERFHRTIKDAVNHRGRAKSFRELKHQLEEFREEYNTVRPHEALNMKRPIERYKKSERVYKAKPTQWEYPENSVVCRVDEAGAVNRDGNRYFISEALLGEQVRLEPVDDSCLVSFRNMYIRQIYPATGRSTMVLLPVAGLH